MHLLLDFDNIDFRDRRLGVELLVANVLDSIGPNNLTNRERVVVRIYGGWFDGQKRSKRGHELLQQLSAAFQTPMTIADTGGGKVILVKAGLADALLAAPSKALTHTFREAPVDLSRIAQAKPPYRGCGAP